MRFKFRNRRKYLWCLQSINKKRFSRRDRENEERIFFFYLFKKK